MDNSNLRQGTHFLLRISRPYTIFLSYKALTPHHMCRQDKNITPPPTPSFRVWWVELSWQTDHNINTHNFDVIRA